MCDRRTGPAPSLSPPLCRAAAGRDGSSARWRPGSRAATQRGSLVSRRVIAPPRASALAGGNALARALAGRRGRGRWRVRMADGSGKRNERRRNGPRIQVSVLRGGHVAQDRVLGLRGVRRWRRRGRRSRRPGRGPRRIRRIPLRARGPRARRRHGGPRRGRGGLAARHRGCWERFHRCRLAGTHRGRGSNGRFNLGRPVNREVRHGAGAEVGLQHRSGVGGVDDARDKLVEHPMATRTRRTSRWLSWNRRLHSRLHKRRARRRASGRGVGKNRRCGGGDVEARREDGLPVEAEPFGRAGGHLR